MPISTLHFTGLGPFKEVDFEFDPQINLFVGPNNCGKSTVLFALADLSVIPFLVPRKLVHERSAAFRAYFSHKRRKHVVEGTFPIHSTSQSQDWSHEKFKRYELQRNELGYTSFVPALRWSTDYRSKGPMQARRDDRRRGVYVRDEDGDFVAASKHQEEESRASLVRDERIVQEIIELDYRAYRQDKPAMRGILKEIAALASEITEGFPIAFSGIAEDKRGLYPEFDTPDGKMPLDVLSQGTQSLIQWLAQLFIGYAKHYDFPANLRDKPGILIIDEIDAHLHPSWQRRILPAVTTHFPSLQIFCSTHSPLMLAGLRAGQVHLLARRSKGKVTVSRNENDIRGWSADEILTGFLGVESATDLDSERNLQRLQELRAKRRLTAKQRKELESLRDSVNEGLLTGPAAEEIARVTKRLSRSGAGRSVSTSTKTSRSGKKRTALRATRSTRSSKKAAK
ncbi:MAG: AAA family ATPase [Planctomycetes bacterium]|nr:AAA family ATPase [Planctomycetota bacterium]